MAVILIVDDVVENVRLLKNLVQDLGRVVFATDGASALAQADTHRPDLILLDVMMPGIDGYEIMRRLKGQEHTRHAAVIFITGADAEDQEAEGLGLGAIDYITKPFKPAIVRARVQNHLALVQAQQDLRAANEALQRMAVTDSLTGLVNRRRLIEMGTQELARSQRMPKTQNLICALMIDIDHFKAINDEHGHPAGDAVIQAVARTCAEAVRAIDTVGRLGGEEFAVVLPLTDCKGGVELADRLRQRVEKTPVPWEGREIRVTISVGVAQGTPKTRSFQALLGAAEQALYRAKNAGRNRVAATIYGTAEEVPT